MSEIDLHTHSTASDGSLSPEELIRAGRLAGLQALALTDHDTVSGLHRAIRAGREHGLEVIPGCELSVQSPKGFMHLLGLWLPLGPTKLQAALVWLQDMRRQRNEQILAALRSLGISIAEREVKEQAKGESIGRPHIAQTLVRKGVVDSIEQAFAQFVGSTGQAYVPKVKLSAQQAVSILKQEQATVILAHPYSLRMPSQEFAAHLQHMQAMGLDGLEVYYPEHTAEQTRLYASLAQAMNLVLSGGSDFHGRIKPDISLGTGRGGLDLPYSLVEKMKAARRRQGLPVDNRQTG
jgi:hypothetical protein